MAPEGAKIGPRRAQEGPRWAQDGPKRAQDRPKRAQDGPKMGPRWPQDGLKIDLRRLSHIKPRKKSKSHTAPGFGTCFGALLGALHGPTLLESVKKSPLFGQGLRFLEDTSPGQGLREVS